MDRLEAVRQLVDGLLLGMTDLQERRTAYVHLYGVSQACTILAMKRKQNVELAAIAGMLHDISGSARKVVEKANEKGSTAKHLIRPLRRAPSPQAGKEGLPRLSAPSVATCNYKKAVKQRLLL